MAEKIQAKYTYGAFIFICFDRWRKIVKSNSENSLTDLEG